MLLRIICQIFVEVLISKQPVSLILYAYFELQCERAFLELYRAVRLVDVRKFACESLEF